MTAPVHGTGLDAQADRRAAMVSVQIAARGIRDPRLLRAMHDLPRHEFLPEHVRAQAYDDRPLPIGEGQTISQPYMVAAMTEAASIGGDDRVLDVGTGSGYQAAVLAWLGRSVVSIERRPALAAQARATARRLGIVNLVVLDGDGSEGVPVFAPYDAIMVAAGAPAVPASLVSQLADGGRLVIPIGSAELQHVTVVRRDGDRLTEERREGCVFVPLVGRQGWDEREK